MAWNFWPLDVATLPAKGLQEPAIWLELQTALNERRQATGLGTVTLSGAATGEALFKASDLATFQATIQATVPHFVNHHDNAGNWNEVTRSNHAPLWTVGSGTHNIFDAAYANVGDGTNWTRKLGTAPGSVTTFYGQVQQGDYVAILKEGVMLKVAEYLNEMYRVIDQMRWTKVISGFTYDLADPTKRTYEAQQSDAGATYAIAYANLLAAWGPPPWLYSITGTIIGHVCDLGPPGGVVTALGASYRGYCYTTSIPTVPFQCSVDYYGFATLPTGGVYQYDEWDSNGTGYLRDRAYLVDSTGEFVSGPNIGTILLGNDNSLQDKPVSDPTNAGKQSVRGYYLYGTVWHPDIAVKSVVKWDGPNGFTKVT